MQDTEQYEAAANHLLQILYLATKNPGLIKPEDLQTWLTVAANEREKQGDHLASGLLTQWASEAERVAKGNAPHVA